MQTTFTVACYRYTDGLLGLSPEDMDLYLALFPERAAAGPDTVSYLTELVAEMGEFFQQNARAEAVTFVRDGICVRRVKLASGEQVFVVKLDPLHVGDSPLQIPANWADLLSQGEQPLRALHCIRIEVSMFHTVTVGGAPTPSLGGDLEVFASRLNQAGLLVGDAPTLALALREQPALVLCQKPLRITLSRRHGGFVIVLSAPGEHPLDLPPQEFPLIADADLVRLANQRADTICNAFS